MKATDTETLASYLVNEIVCRYGVPSYLHSDQGANLTSNLMTALCKQLGTTQTRTSAYYPQGNGQVERFNRTLESMLAKVVDHQTDWGHSSPTGLICLSNIHSQHNRIYSFSYYIWTFSYTTNRYNDWDISTTM